MNILVLLKQVPDTETKIQLEGNTQINKNGIKWIMNPYDEFALEQAIQIKERNAGSQIVALRLGEALEPDILRTALALGADQAICIEADNFLMEAQTTAMAIKKTLEKEGITPDIILAGKQSIDNDSSQVPAQLAALYQIPSISNIISFEQNGDQFQIAREVEGGNTEHYELATPFLVSCNKGLNAPRYPKLPSIMKAKRIPITKIKLEELNIESNMGFELEALIIPNTERLKKVFDASNEDNISSVVAQVVAELKNNNIL